ncbi:MAG: hypothetical protein IPM54_22845 [Polyangiaceae bacterium]|nr:hypothetical protein [Polyangiaceae bacterium]
MTPDLPDPSLYSRAPVITVEAGIALCRTLAAAKPKSPPNAVKKAATKLVIVADAAQNALAVRQKEVASISDENAREVDQSGDGSWGALRMRVEACSMLPPSNPDAKRANELLAILFGPEGLSFLKLTYAEQWATADTILKRIDEDGLQKDIDHIAGPAYLAHVRQQHTAYGAMVQSLMRRDDATNVNLNDHVRTMGRAIVDYATKVLAMLDEEEPESITTVRDALRPLDAYREANARRNSKAATPAEPSQPPAEGGTS